MGRRSWLGLFVLAVLSASSCDSDQPLQVGEQSGLLEIVASGARVPRFFTWIIYEDTNQDMNPDDSDGDGNTTDDPDDVTLWCDAPGGTETTGFPLSVPWTYGLEVSIKRAGETTEEMQTSVQALSTAFNRAPYDPQEPNNFETGPGIFPVTHDRGECSLNTAIVCNPNSSVDPCDTRFDEGVCLEVNICSTPQAGGGETRCDPSFPGGDCPVGAGTCTLSNRCSGNPLISCQFTCSEVGLGNCVLDEVTRRFRFDLTTPMLRRTLTEANRELLETEGNFLHDACDGDPSCKAWVDAGLFQVGLGQDPILGFCPGSLAGEPAMDPGNPNSDATSLAFSLDPGDTLLAQL